ncbi:MAG: thiol peroxidase [Candidatus Promineifilaceae bacterium]|jgi:thiol peroxidase
MAQITFKGTPLETSGTLPSVGSDAPSFTLAKTDLSDLKLSDLRGQTVVLNIFPSIDTPTCQASARRFNQEAADRDGVTVVCISADLPFAHGRFCEAEGLSSVVTASAFRSLDFGVAYGVTVAEGPLRGLLSRAVVVVDADGKVTHAEQVPELADEPNYDAALAAL